MPPENQDFLIFLIGQESEAVPPPASRRPLDPAMPNLARNSPGSEESRPAVATAGAKAPPIWRNQHAEFASREKRRPLWKGKCHPTLNPPEAGMRLRYQEGSRRPTPHGSGDDHRSAQRTRLNPPVPVRANGAPAYGCPPPRAWSRKGRPPVALRPKRRRPAFRSPYRPGESPFAKESRDSPPT